MQLPGVSSLDDLIRGGGAIGRLNRASDPYGGPERRQRRRIPVGNEQQVRDALQTYIKEHPPEDITGNTRAWWMTALETLDVPRNIVANVAAKLTGVKPSSKERFAGLRKIYGADFLRAAGIQTGSKVGDFLLGLGVDIIGDPLTWGSFGAAAYARGGVKLGARVLKHAYRSAYEGALKSGGRAAGLEQLAKAAGSELPGVAKRLAAPAVEGKVGYAERLNLMAPDRFERYAEKVLTRAERVGGKRISDPRGAGFGVTTNILRTTPFPALVAGPIPYIPSLAMRMAGKVKAAEKYEKVLNSALLTPGKFLPRAEKFVSLYDTPAGPIWKAVKKSAGQSETAHLLRRWSAPVSRDLRRLFSTKPASKIEKVLAETNLWRRGATAQMDAAALSKKGQVMSLAQHYEVEPEAMGQVILAIQERAGAIRYKFEIAGGVDTDFDWAAVRGAQKEMVNTVRDILKGGNEKRINELATDLLRFTIEPARETLAAAARVSAIGDPDAPIELPALRTTHGQLAARRDQALTDWQRARTEQRELRKGSNEYAAKGLELDGLNKRLGAAQAALTRFGKKRAARFSDEAARAGQVLDMNVLQFAHLDAIEAGDPVLGPQIRKLLESAGQMLGEPVTTKGTGRTHAIKFLLGEYLASPAGKPVGGGLFEDLVAGGIHRTVEELGDAIRGKKMTGYTPPQSVEDARHLLGDGSRPLSYEETHEALRILADKVPESKGPMFDDAGRTILPDQGQTLLQTAKPEPTRRRSPADLHRQALNDAARDRRPGPQVSPTEKTRLESLVSDQLGDAMDRVGVRWAPKLKTNARGMVQLDIKQGKFRAFLTFTPTAGDDTAFHETLHLATELLGESKTWNRLLRDHGWDGKARDTGWQAAQEKLANAYMDFALGYRKPTGAMARIFERLRELFAKTSKWLDGQGFTDQAETFRLLREGKLQTRRDLAITAGGGPALHGTAKSLAPTFYSKLRRVVADKVGGKVGRVQLLNTLKNNGIKDEEIEWAFLGDLFTGGKKSVTKDQLDDWLAVHDVQIEEVKLGYQPIADEYAQLTPKQSREVFWRVAEEEGMDLDSIQSTLEDIDHGAPIDHLDLPPRVAAMGESLGIGYGPLETRPRYDGYVLPGGKNYRELLLKFKNPRGTGPYRSAHWPDKRGEDVLVHVRFNERTDPDGKRVLFLEEIQSDWHAQGRVKGYGGKMGVPDAPFKGAAGYGALALKRMVRWAAENGFDQVAWTPGSVQADRYDLRKQVDLIEWWRNEDGTFGLSPVKNGEELDLGDQLATLKDSDLADYIGKDAARKIRESAESVSTNPKVAARGELKGDDLAVGGAGMAKFYDHILPAVARKLGKKHGAKVVKGKIAGKSKPFNFGTAYTLDDLDASWLATDGLIKHNAYEGNFLTDPPADITAEQRLISRAVARDPAVLAARGKVIQAPEEYRQLAAAEYKKAASEALDRLNMDLAYMTDRMRNGGIPYQQLVKHGTAGPFSDVTKELLHMRIEMTPKSFGVHTLDITPGLRDSVLHTGQELFQKPKKPKPKPAKPGDADKYYPFKNITEAKRYAQYVGWEDHPKYGTADRPAVTKKNWFSAKQAMVREGVIPLDGPAIDVPNVPKAPMQKYTLDPPGPEGAEQLHDAIRTVLRRGRTPEPAAVVNLLKFTGPEHMFEVLGVRSLAGTTAEGLTHRQVALRRIHNALVEIGRAGPDMPAEATNMSEAQWGYLFKQKLEESGAGKQKLPLSGRQKLLDLGLLEKVEGKLGQVQLTESGRAAVDQYPNHRRLLDPNIETSLTQDIASLTSEIDQLALTGGNRTSKIGKLNRRRRLLERVRRAIDDDPNVQDVGKRADAAMKDVPEIDELLGDTPIARGAHAMLLDLDMADLERSAGLPIADFENLRRMSYAPHLMDEGSTPIGRFFRKLGMNAEAAMVPGGRNTLRAEIRDFLNIERGKRGQPALGPNDPAITVAVDMMLAEDFSVKHGSMFMRQIARESTIDEINSMLREMGAGSKLIDDPTTLFIMRKTRSIKVLGAAKLLKGLVAKGIGVKVSPKGAMPKGFEHYQRIQHATLGNLFKQLAFAPEDARMINRWLAVGDNLPAVVRGYDHFLSLWKSMVLGVPAYTIRNIWSATYQGLVTGSFDYSSVGDAFTMMKETHGAKRLWAEADAIQFTDPRRSQQLKARAQKILSTPIKGTKAQKSGTNMTYGELYDALEFEHGVLGKGFHGQEMDAVVARVWNDPTGWAFVQEFREGWKTGWTGPAWAGDGWKNRHPQLARLVGRTASPAAAYYRGFKAINKAVEDHIRVAGVIAGLRKGRNLEEAVATMLMGQFDYADIPEQFKWIKRMVPFATFVKKNAELVWWTVHARPQFLALMPKLRGDAEATFAGDATTPPSLRPKHILNEYGVQINDDPVDPQYFNLGYTFPIKETGLLTGPGQAVRQLSDSMSPFIKLPMELARNRDSFFDRPITAYPGQKKRFLGVEMPAVAKHLARQIRPLNEMHRLSWTDDNVKRAAMLGGVRTFPVSNLRQVAARDRTLAEQRGRIKADMQIAAGRGDQGELDRLAQLYAQLDARQSGISHPRARAAMLTPEQAAERQNRRDLATQAIEATR